jgi:TonB family protein
MSTATQVWENWQRQTVDGKFPLLHGLGGSEQSVVFLTERSGREPRQAVIKLIPAGGRDDDAQLARWAATANLDHPHLLHLFESGRCELDGARYLYVVMEYAEENLSEIVPQRPLLPAEASLMLQPTIEVLGYLHQAGFVHGRIKPSNILAVDNQLKISADGLFKKGERLGARRLTAYDAPEVSTAGLSPEADLWSLGVTLVATLTQNAPDFTNSNPPQAIVPETVPQPFREIARRCLSVDPQQRGTVAEIQTRLQTPALPAPRKVEMQAGKEHSRRRMLLAAVIVIMLLAVLGVRAFLARRPPVPPAARATQSASGVAAEPSPPPLSETQNQAKGTVHGKVSRQVVPNVPPIARNTISGKVKVNVRVSVDPSGKVSEARLGAHVESKYFARLAVESARQWIFTPARVDGQAVASEWTLRFQFGRAGTQVFPTEVRP